jgi:hypothetical protein
VGREEEPLSGLEGGSFMIYPQISNIIHYDYYFYEKHVFLIIRFLPGLKIKK